VERCELSTVIHTLFVYIKMLLYQRFKQLITKVIHNKNLSCE